MSADDLLRSLADQHAVKASGVASLVSLPEDDLYALLGSRAANRNTPAGNGEDEFRTVNVIDDITRGPAAELGKRIFARCSSAAHEFCCSAGDEDKKLRDQMLQAIFSKDGGGIALLAGGLVAAFGLSPAIAAVVAALLVKILVAPTVNELCATWDASLKNPRSTA